MGSPSLHRGEDEVLSGSSLWIFLSSTSPGCAHIILVMGSGVEGSCGCGDGGLEGQGCLVLSRQPNMRKEYVKEDRMVLASEQSP